MAENSDIPQRSGFYTGGTYGFPTPVGGLGGGLYFDDAGNFYPQFYWGTPRWGFSSGHATDLDEYLTGPSASITLGGAPLAYHVGGNTTSAGQGISTPGVGFTYGFGPYRTRDIPSYIAKLPTLLYPRGPFQEIYPMP